MNIHPPIVAAIPEALHDIFVSGYYADNVVGRRMRAHKNWGSRDRKAFAEAVYDIVRWWRTLHFLLGWPWQDGAGKDYSLEQMSEFFLAWLVLKDRPIPEWMETEPTTEILDRLQELKNADRATKESIPDWLDELASSEIKGPWDDCLAALNDKAPVFLRIISLKIDA